LSDPKNYSTPFEVSKPQCLLLILSGTVMQERSAIIGRKTTTGGVADIAARLAEMLLHMEQASVFVGFRSSGTIVAGPSTARESVVKVCGVWTP
jgi:hypothetical protein